MVRGGRLARRAGAVACGLLADARWGEPARCHPVAGFGTVMTAAEARWWADDRRRGAAYAALGLVGAGAVGQGAAALAGPWTALAAATWASSAGRALLATAEQVAAALAAGEVEAARRLLPSLVGRSAEGLDEKEIARAVVESVAENLSDAVVGTAVWGLAAGAPGALVHRAANTLDAMVGHRTPRHRQFGWAAARVDDVLGWPAARLTALLVAAAAPGRAPAVWRAVRRDAPAHPSPNAGVAEAAFAAALGLRLGGANRYGDRVEVLPALGTGRPPELDDIAAAVALARRVLRVLTVGLALLAVAGSARSALRRRTRAGGARP